MKQLIVITVCFLIMDKAAADEWLCRTQSSEVQGRAIYACGIATAKTEDLAREKALAAAKREFTALCDMSENCRNHVADVSPQRTECFPEKGEIKCYRGILFEPTDKIADSITTTAGLEVPLKPKAKPRIYINQSKQDLLKELGAPSGVSDALFDSSKYYTYSIKGCSAAFCFVIVDKNKVIRYDSNWDPLMTDALDH